MAPNEGDKDSLGDLEKVDYSAPFPEHLIKKENITEYGEEIELAGIPGKWKFVKIPGIINVSGAIDLDKITPNPGQPRSYFDPVKMAKIKNLIEAKGQRVAIEVVSIINEKGEFRILITDGERRFRSLRELNEKDGAGRKAQIKGAYISTLLELNYDSFMFNDGREGHTKYEKGAWYRTTVLMEMRKETSLSLEDAIKLVVENTGGTESAQTIKNLIKLADLCDEEDKKLPPEKRPSILRQLANRDQLTGNINFLIDKLLKQGVEISTVLKIAVGIATNSEKDLSNARTISEIIGNDEEDSGFVLTEEAVREAAIAILMGKGSADDAAQLKVAKTIQSVRSGMTRLSRELKSLLNGSPRAIKQLLRRQSIPPEVIAENMSEVVELTGRVLREFVSPVIVPPLEDIEGAPDFYTYIGKNRKNIKDRTRYEIARLLAGNTDKTGGVTKFADICQRLELQTNTAWLHYLKELIVELESIGISLKRHNVKIRKGKCNAMDDVVHYRLEWTLAAAERLKAGKTPIPEDGEEPESGTEKAEKSSIATPKETPPAKQIVNTGAGIKVVATEDVTTISNPPQPPSSPPPQPELTIQSGNVKKDFKEIPAADTQPAMTLHGGKTGAVDKPDHLTAPQEPNKPVSHPIDDADKITTEVAGKVLVASVPETKTLDPKCFADTMIYRIGDKYSDKYDPKIASSSLRIITTSHPAYKTRSLDSTQVVVVKEKDSEQVPGKQQTFIVRKGVLRISKIIPQAEGSMLKEENMESKYKDRSTYTIDGNFERLTELGKYKIRIMGPNHERYGQVYVSERNIEKPIALISEGMEVGYCAVVNVALVQIKPKEQAVEKQPGREAPVEQAAPSVQHLVKPEISAQKIKPKTLIKIEGQPSKIAYVGGDTIYKIMKDRAMEYGRGIPAIGDVTMKGIVMREISGGHERFKTVMDMSQKIPEGYTIVAIVTSQDIEIGYACVARNDLEKVGNRPVAKNPGQGARQDHKEGEEEKKGEKPEATTHEGIEIHKERYPQKLDVPVHTDNNVKIAEGTTVEVIPKGDPESVKWEKKNRALKPKERLIKVEIDGEGSKVLVVWHTQLIELTDKTRRERNKKPGAGIPGKSGHQKIGDNKRRKASQRTKKGDTRPFHR